jgi:hypothetical protein
VTRVALAAALGAAGLCSPYAAGISRLAGTALAFVTAPALCRNGHIGGCNATSGGTALFAAQCAAAVALLHICSLHSCVDSCQPTPEVRLDLPSNLHAQALFSWSLVNWRGFLCIGPYMGGPPAVRLCQGFGVSDRHTLWWCRKQGIISCSSSTKSGPGNWGASHEEARGVWWMGLLWDSVCSWQMAGSPQCGGWQTLQGCPFRWRSLQQGRAHTRSGEISRQSQTADQHDKAPASGRQSLSEC